MFNEFNAGKVYLIINNSLLIPKAAESLFVFYSKTLHFDLPDPETYRRKKGPPKVNIRKLIAKVGRFQDDRFIYLTYLVPKSSEFFTPYSFKEVPYDDVDKSQFYTISRYGVTLWSRDETYFTNISIWQEEYEQYCRLMTVSSQKFSSI